MIAATYSTYIRTSRNITILRVLAQDIATDGDLTDEQCKELNTALSLRITELESEARPADEGRWDFERGISNHAIAK